jgi:UPF0716 protein FxsA
MGRLLVLFFLLMPLLEIAGFILVGQAIGLWATLLGVVVMALVGALVIRWQGLAVIGKLQDAVARGQLPGRQLADAMLIGLAGLLLILPGYVSDLVGLLLLVPPVRGLLYRALAARLNVAAPAAPRDDATRLQGSIDLDDESWRER